MYADKFKLHSLPGGGVEDGEDVLTALRREVYEETGCICDEVQELGIVSENRASLDYTQINHYFVVTTTHSPNENHLTESELDSRTVAKWVAFDELVRLINDQEFDRIQGKYLKARDVAALREYLKCRKD
jgi:8-oxo-dGTP pyrophosphatase MutT (NUDIX family)